MPQFAYQGRNARGELVKGVLEGADSGAVADQLFNTGITPVHIDAASAGLGRAAGGVWQMQIGEPKVELADLMLFCRQMHTLLKAGVPIVRGLAGLQESAENPTLAKVLADVREGEVTPEGALRDYGVQVDLAAGTARRVVAASAAE